jgi:hypothetical protein
MTRKQRGDAQINSTPLSDAQASVWLLSCGAANQTKDGFVYVNAEAVNRAEDQNQVGNEVERGRKLTVRPSRSGEQLSQGTKWIKGRDRLGHKIRWIM